MTNLEPIQDATPALLTRAMGGEDSAAVGVYVLSAEEQKLVVRVCRSNHVLACVLYFLFGLGGTLAAGFLILLEIRDPGGFREFFLNHRLKLQQPAGVHWALEYLATGAFWLAVLVPAMLGLFFVHAFYSELAHGRRPWIFDRSRGLLTRGDEEVRRLEKIRYVLVRKERVGSHSSSYFVSFQPEPDRPTIQNVFKGPRNDRFSFDTQEDALEFAEEIGYFLGLGVVKPDG